MSKTSRRVVVLKFDTDEDASVFLRKTGQGLAAGYSFTVVATAVDLVGYILEGGKFPPFTREGTHRAHRND